MNEDPAPRLLFRLVVVAVALLVVTTTYADPDLWGHVRFGDDIVASRSLPSTDRYSFTSDRSWTNHEWLSEVAMAVAYRAGGPSGLVVLRITLIVATLLVVIWSLRRLAGVPRDAIVLLVVLGTAWVTVSVRPQLFSVLFFSILLALLREVEARHVRLLFWLPAIFVLWVNTHGGWVVGMGVFGVWAALALTRFTSTGDRLSIVAALLASIAATLVNPYGWEMWQFLRSTVRLGRDVQEWQPVLSYPATHVAMWLITLAVAVVALVRSRSRLDLASGAIVALLAFASWRVARLDAFFCLAVALLLAPRLASTTVGAGLAPPDQSTVGVRPENRARQASNRARQASPPPPSVCSPTNHSWASRRRSFLSLFGIGASSLAPRLRLSANLHSACSTSAPTSCSCMWRQLPVCRASPRDSSLILTKRTRCWVFSDFCCLDTRLRWPTSSLLSLF